MCHDTLMRSVRWFRIEAWVSGNCILYCVQCTVDVHNQFIRLKCSIRIDFWTGNSIHKVSSVVFHLAAHQRVPFKLRGDRNDWVEIDFEGFKRNGATIMVAWDSSSGELLASVDGAALRPLFLDGVAPGPVVGTGLFPAVSGYGGCRVLVNVGSRPWRHAPPECFLPWAQAAPLGQVRQADLPQVPLPASPTPSARGSQPGEADVWGQGAGALELLAAFDLVGGRHEGMAADLYNDDAKYKACTVLVRTGYGS